jgi:hypothetical protein
MARNRKHAKKIGTLRFVPNGNAGQLLRELGRRERVEDLGRIVDSFTSIPIAAGFSTYHPTRRRFKLDRIMGTGDYGLGKEPIVLIVRGRDGQERVLGGVVVQPGQKGEPK